jgi:hypothetical protein
LLGAARAFSGQLTEVLCGGTPLLPPHAVAARFDLPKTDCEESNVTEEFAPLLLYQVERVENDYRDGQLSRYPGAILSRPRVS